MKRKAAVAILALCCAAALLLAATNQTFILTAQNAGASIGTWLNYVSINCSTGMTCTASGSTITMTASGGGSLPSGTKGCSLVNSNGTTGYTTSCAVKYADQFSGATMDVQVAAALAALPSGGGVIDARGLNGTQSWAANPLASLVGSGYNPSTQVYILLCNVTINVAATITLPSGTHLVGCGRESVTIQAGSGFPVTDTAGTVVSTTAASGTPYLSTWTGSGTDWSAAQQGSIVGICTASNGTGSSCGANTGSINFGQIQTVSSTTSMTVYIDNANNGTANTTGTYNYVLFSPVVLLGDLSGSSGANPNFDVEVRGIHIGTQGKSGAIPLAVYNCQQQCTADDFTLSPSNSQGLDIETSQAQEAGPFSNFWITASDCSGTTANPVGIMIRMAGSSTIASVRDFSVALSGCFTTGNGATYPVILDSQAHLGPGIHLLTGNSGNTTTVGITIAKSTPVVCPIYCLSAASSVNGAIVEDVNAAGNGGLAAVRIGTNNSPTNVRVSGIKAATGATGFTDTFIDDNNSCTILRPTSGSLEATLNEYLLNSLGGIGYSTSSTCPQLPLMVGSQYNTSQYTNATAALTTISTSPTIQPGWLVRVECTGTYAVTGTAEIAKFALLASQTPQNIAYGGVINYSASAGVGSIAQNSNGGLITAGGAVSSTAGIFQFIIQGTIQWNASTAGTIAFQGESSNVAGTLTINAYNSSCTETRLQ